MGGTTGAVRLGARAEARIVMTASVHDEREGSTGTVMVSYEAPATVVATLTGEWGQFMCEHHIPALLATGCFNGATHHHSPG